MRQNDEPNVFYPETLASIKTKAPSESFLEGKKKFEEEKKQQNYYQKFSN